MNLLILATPTNKAAVEAALDVIPGGPWELTRQLSKVSNEHLELYLAHLANPSSELYQQIIDALEDTPALLIQVEQESVAQALEGAGEGYRFRPALTSVQPPTNALMDALDALRGIETTGTLPDRYLEHLEDSNYNTDED